MIVPLIRVTSVLDVAVDTVPLVVGSSVTPGVDITDMSEVLLSFQLPGAMIGSSSTLSDDGDVIAEVAEPGAAVGPAKVDELPAGNGGPAVAEAEISACDERDGKVVTLPGRRLDTRTVLDCVMLLKTVPLLAEEGTAEAVAAPELVGGLTVGRMMPLPVC